MFLKPVPHYSDETGKPRVPLEYWGGSSMRALRGETERKQEAECGMFKAEKARAAVKDGKSILMPFHIKLQADEVEMQTEKKRKTTGSNDGMNVQ